MNQYKCIYTNKENLIPVDVSAEDEIDAEHLSRIKLNNMNLENKDEYKILEVEEINNDTTIWIKPEKSINTKELLWA